MNDFAEIRSLPIIFQLEARPGEHEKDNHKIFDEKLNFGHIFLQTLVPKSHLGLEEVDMVLKPDKSFNKVDTNEEISNFNYGESWNMAKTLSDHHNFIDPMSKKAKVALDAMVSIDALASMTSARNDKARIDVDRVENSGEFVSQEFDSQVSKYFSAKDTDAIELLGKRIPMEFIDLQKNSLSDQEAGIAIEGDGKQYLDAYIEGDEAYGEVSGDIIHTQAEMSEVVSDSEHENNHLASINSSEDRSFLNFLLNYSGSEVPSIHDSENYNKKIHFPSSSSNISAEDLLGEYGNVKNISRNIDFAHKELLIDLERSMKNIVQVPSSSLSIDSELKHSTSGGLSIFNEEEKYFNSNEIYNQRTSVLGASREFNIIEAVNSYVQNDKRLASFSKAPHAVPVSNENLMIDAGKPSPESVTVHVRNISNESLDLKFTTERLHIMQLLDKNQYNLVEELQEHGFENFNLTFFMSDRGQRDDIGNFLEYNELDPSDPSDASTLEPYMSINPDGTPLDIIV